MSRRTRRKSTISRKSFCESDDSDEEEKESPIEKQKRNKRMKASDDEAFVKICVEKFDEINDKTTVRGTSTTVKAIREKCDNAWKEITKSMNELTNVSYFYFFL